MRGGIWRDDRLRRGRLRRGRLRRGRLRRGRMRRGGRMINEGKIRTEKNMERRRLKDANKQE